MAVNRRRYVVAVGQPWGLRAFGQVAGLGRATWECVPTEEALVASLLGEPRYVFLLNWSRRVPDDITRAFEVVNFHCTPLPFGRGGHPIENLLRRGHTETVVTAHRVTDVLDGGPIYMRRGPVSLAGTKTEILDRFVAPCVAMMIEIVKREPVPTPQVGTPVMFKRLTDDEYEKFWAARR